MISRDLFRKNENEAPNSVSSLQINTLGTGLLHSDSLGNVSSSLLVNADVSSSAAIAYSKLNLTGDVVNADINASAAIAYSKLNLASSIQVSDLNSTAYSTGNNFNRLVQRDGNSGGFTAGQTTFTQNGYNPGVIANLTLNQASSTTTSNMYLYSDATSCWIKNQNQKTIFSSNQSTNVLTIGDATIGNGINLNSQTLIQGASGVQLAILYSATSTSSTTSQLKLYTGDANSLGYVYSNATSCGMVNNGGGNVVSCNQTSGVATLGASAGALLTFNTKAITSAYTVSATDYGQVLLVSNAGGAYTITLPAPSAGTFVKIIISGSLAAAVTISSSGANIVGNIVSSTGTAVTNGAIGVGKTNIAISTTNLGDWYEFISDGSHYFLRGMTNTPAGITIS